MDAEVIIVGTGPAAVASLVSLQEKEVLVLDVGLKSSQNQLKKESIYSIRSNGEDIFDLALGENFSGLQNLLGSYISPKLKAPMVRYITEQSQELTPAILENFNPTLSMAQGGLAQGWGAGLYQFNDRELESFPISAQDLSPYYDYLTRLIGISGTDDDLSPFFGESKQLQSPMKLDRHGRNLLNTYQKNKSFFNKQGVYIGYPRLGILTREKDGRPAYNYSGLESFQSDNPSIYSPSITFKELLEKRKNIRYQDSFYVDSFENIEGGIEVSGRHLKTNETRRFRARHLALGAGSINTAKIVLQSHSKGKNTRLPLVENSTRFIPFLRWKSLGLSQEKNFFAGAQLNMVIEDKSLAFIQGSYYGISGVMRSDFLGEFPCPINQSIALSKILAPAFSVLQLFYPGAPSSENYLELLGDNRLRLHYGQEAHFSKEKEIIRLFRKGSYFSHSKLIHRPAPGHSIHYAGSLPMVNKPEQWFQCDPRGRLAAYPRVRIIDAAGFPKLPSKNHSFTIMANSMRIAEHLKRDL